MKRLKLFIPLIAFAVLAGVLGAAMFSNQTELLSALIGKPVPNFSLPSLQDPNTLISQDTYKGKSYLLNVWATWCPACSVEHPYLVKLAKAGIPIVGINYKDDSAAAKRMLADNEDPYLANIVDKNGNIGLDLGVYGAQETYIVLSLIQT